ncbi:esterase-like activity of phytase family protein [Erythrobacter tepidarius]|uniref:esterase-like activity of phytase family protein n=1 Tax=Erythrobacter tepidarius TaxID=60454 RepID=UPI00117BFA6C|nr:esterase-like activity of phytase family protein [Erythrobacter tepidarius]
MRAWATRGLLLAVVALGLGPGLFWRAPTGQRSDTAQVSLTPVAERAGVAGVLRLSGAWEMRAAHGWFGGFSALVAGGRGLIAGSDRGFLLEIDLAGPVPRAVPGSFRFVGDSSRGREEVVDLESLAYDPASGTLWGGFENFNLVTRFAPDGTRTSTTPHAMRRWSANSGAETMERLEDGRFLIIAEGPLRGSQTHHEALLFSGDPVETGALAPLAFVLLAPADYDPVDAAQLPDGRVLILLRRVEYALPARFDTAIAIADPAAVRPGKAWPARVIQRLSGGLFADNFEGIAFVPDPADPARGAVWLVSDDNFSVFQRNLLVRFDWDARSARAP